jgi:hypothetical protein
LDHFVRSSLDDIGPSCEDPGIAVMKEKNQLQFDYDELVKSLAPRVDVLY